MEIDTTKKKIHCVNLKMEALFNKSTSQYELLSVELSMAWEPSYSTSFEALKKLIYGKDPILSFHLNKKKKDF